MKVYTLVKKKIILIFFLVLLSGLFFSQTPAQSESENELFSSPVISMDFQDANLKDVLKVFSQQAGLNFIASEKVKDRKVTLYLDKVSVQDALNTIMNANNLIYEQEKDSKIFIVKEWSMPEVETTTKIFFLQYARVKGVDFEEGERRQEERTGIKEIVEKLLSEHGRVIEDFRTNSLIVTDVPSQFAQIEKTIRELDVKLPQVMIEAEVVETSLELVDKLGIAWGTNDEGELLTGFGAARSSNWPFSKNLPNIGPGGDVDNLFLGHISANNLGGTLAMLSRDSDTKILARPKILTLNNETAEIKITADTAIASITETSSAEGIATQAVTAERVETGISLRVTPHVNKVGEITMTIEPSVINTKQSEFFSQFVDPQKRSAKTTVTINNGETVVIGGLINTEDDKNLRKIPYLGDIPLLGHIFRKQDDQTKDKELIIFITPHLVKETAKIGLALEKDTSWKYERLSPKDQIIEMTLDKFER
jgi:type IV pilus assembly protein PilQ